MNGMLNDALGTSAPGWVSGRKGKLARELGSAIIMATTQCETVLPLVSQHFHDIP